jgi:HEPN domain-containing protein
MGIDERVKYWLDVANEDLSLAEYIFKGGRWLYTAFMCHQAIEKTLKAYWVSVCEDEPPYTHSHIKLLNGCGLADKLTEEQFKFLDLMVPMNIEARYPDYKREIAKSLNAEAAQYILEQTKLFTQWISQRFSQETKPSDSSATTSA